MNAQLKERIQQIKFKAFALGYAELYEFITTATWEEPIWYPNETWLSESTWLNNLWDKEIYIDELRFSNTEEWHDRLKESKELNKLQKLVVRQGRKCGMIFRNSYIGYARIQLKP
jgi:hypothetical protein